MNKMIVAVFDAEEDAYEGLDALSALDKKGDITLYATAVLVKDITGKVHIRQAAPEGPIGTAVGMLTGAMVGLLAGPAGAVGMATAAGISTGGLTGLLFDVGSAGVNADFLDEVSDVMIPGKSAVVAEVDEGWVTPVDAKLNQLGGLVFRRPRTEVIEDQLASESAAFNEEVKEIRNELKEGNAKTKAATKKTLQSIEKRLKVIEIRSEEKLDQINKEAKAKIQAMQAHLKGARDAQKEKIEERIAEIKADQKVRSEKLHKANRLAHEALTP